MTLNPKTHYCVIDIPNYNIAHVEFRTGEKKEEFFVTIQCVITSFIN